jgi:hypothetical protein
MVMTPPPASNCKASSVINGLNGSLRLSWDAYEALGYTAGQLSPATIQRFIRLVNQHGRFALDESDPLGTLHKLNYLNNGTIAGRLYCSLPKIRYATTSTSAASKRRA